MTLIFLLLLPLLSLAQPIKPCYWDADCSSSGGECCIGSRCRSFGSCQILRSYPAPMFQACYGSADCDTGCCHNNVCTLEETCNTGSATTPLIVFLVIIGLVTAVLASALIRDCLLYKQKAALEGAMSVEGAKKNQ